MKAYYLTFVVALGLSAVSPAQGITVSPKVKAEVKAEVNARVKEMREAIRDGLPIITNVRVTVKLRNSHKIKGVVKRGRLIERASGLDFVLADTKTPGAGLRVWYYNNTNSYIFMPFTSIESYRIGVRLTDVQVKKIESRIDADRKRADEARQAYLAAKAARRAQSGQAEGKAGAEGEEVAETLEERHAREVGEAKLLALLEEFPPDDGWGEQRLHEIQMRKITIGAYPDKQSQRFIDIFGDWQRAVKLQAAKDAEAEAEEPPPSPSGGGGKKVGKG